MNIYPALSVPMVYFILLLDLALIGGAYVVRSFDTHGWGNHIVGFNRPFMRIWSIKKYAAYLILDTWIFPALIIVAALCVLNVVTLLLLG